MFKRLRESGAIARGTRFQVSLPTPHSSGYLYVSGPARPTYFRVYERALLKALANIVEGDPGADLAIQWDVCQEVLAFENYFKDRPADYKKQTFDMLGRLGDAVPAGVELGYHLCYGSPADEHLVQPKDAAVLVEMLDGIAAATKRPIDFFHIPVPKERTDEAFYAPLKALEAAGRNRALSRAAASQRRGGRQNARRRRAKSSFRISGSRPNAAGAEPSRAGCPACSKGIVLLRRHSDG